VLGERGGTGHLLCGERGDKRDMSKGEGNEQAKDARRIRTAIRSSGLAGIVDSAARGGRRRTRSGRVRARDVGGLSSRTKL
jgi:hypothetical protein